MTPTELGRLERAVQFLVERPAGKHLVTREAGPHVPHFEPRRGFRHEPEVGARAQVGLVTPGADINFVAGPLTRVERAGRQIRPHAVEPELVLARHVAVERSLGIEFLEVDDLAATADAEQAAAGAEEDLGPRTCREGNVALPILHLVEDVGVDAEVGEAETRNQANGAKVKRRRRDRVAGGHLLCGRRTPTDHD